MAIFGTIETVKAQINNPSFEKAFLYIDKLQDKNSDECKSLSNIGLDDCNKIVLDEHCFVLEQAYISKNKEDCFFESHKKYIDIQYMVKGNEIMDVTHIDNLEIIKNYDEKTDFIKYENKCDDISSLLIGENELAIFYPTDAHQPCIKVDDSKLIYKAVIKIPVE